MKKSDLDKMNLNATINKFNKAIQNNTCIYDKEAYANVNFNDTFQRVNEEKVSYVPTTSNITNISSSISSDVVIAN